MHEPAPAIDRARARTARAFSPRPLYSRPKNRVKETTRRLRAAPQAGSGERVGQQVGQIEHERVSAGAVDDDGTHAKLGQHLAAGPAGGRLRGAARDGDGEQAPVPFGDRQVHGRAFGADGEAERRVLDVAAAGDGARAGQHRGADVEAGVRRVCPAPGRACRTDQVIGRPCAGTAGARHSKRSRSREGPSSVSRYGGVTMPAETTSLSASSMLISSRITWLSGTRHKNPVVGFGVVITKTLRTRSLVLAWASPRVSPVTNPTE